MSQQKITPQQPYKKVLLETSDPEFAFIHKYFFSDAPSNRALGKVYCIHNGSLHKGFETNIPSMDLEAQSPHFKARWPQMSNAQHIYARYVASHPGCTIADVDRACRRNPLAGHRWVYDGVHRLIRQGVLEDRRNGHRTSLYVV